MSKLEELENAVAKATDALREAEQVASAARSEETDCLNRLNQAQKAFDAYVQEIRKVAPRSSDWRRAERDAARLPARAK